MGVVCFCIKMLSRLILSVSHVVIANAKCFFPLFCCNISQYMLIYVDRLTNKLQFCGFVFVISTLLKN